MAGIPAYIVHAVQHVNIQFNCSTSTLHHQWSSAPSSMQMHRCLWTQAAAAYRDL